MPFVSLVGVCQNVATFILYLPLFGKGLEKLKWMILVFLGVVTGPEELEGFGRERGSLGKRTALSCGVLGIPLTCTAGDGKGFVLLGMCMMSVLKGGVYHWLRTNQTYESTIRINHTNQPYESTVRINRTSQPYESTVRINHRNQP